MADLTSSLILLPAIIFSNRIDFTDPTNILLARAAFGIAETIGAIILCYIYYKILNNKDTKIIQVKKQAQLGQSSPPEGEMESLTVQDYDFRELKSQATQLILRIAIISFIHFYWSLAVPLVIQLVSVPVSMYKAPLIQIYLLGKTIVRPFPPPPDPFDFMRQKEPLKKKKQTKPSNKDILKKQEETKMRSKEGEDKPKSE